MQSEKNVKSSSTSESSGGADSGGSHNIQSWKMPNGFTLAGYSRAADATFFYVPELKLQLDLGGASKKYYAESFFLSHSHLDHAIYVNCVQPAGFYNLNADTRHTLFAPKEIVPYVKQFMLAGQQLNDVQDINADEWLSKERVKFDIMGVISGGTHLINKHLSLYCRIISCTHGVPSIGFIFFEKRLKLKPEYSGLPGKEIANLRRSGVEIQTQLDVPLFAFLGDTTAQVFADHPELFEVPVIITECTFLLDGHEQQAKDSWHTHWKDVEPFVRDHPKVTFAFIHFSLRYRDQVISDFFLEKKKTYANIHAFV